MTFNFITTKRAARLSCTSQRPISTLRPTKTTRSPGANQPEKRSSRWSRNRAPRARTTKTARSSRGRSTCRRSTRTRARRSPTTTRRMTSRDRPLSSRWTPTTSSLEKSSWPPQRSKSLITTLRTRLARRPRCNSSCRLRRGAAAVRRRPAGQGDSRT